MSAVTVAGIGLSTLELAALIGGVGIAFVVALAGGLWVYKTGGRADEDEQERQDPIRDAESISVVQEFDEDENPEAQIVELQPPQFKRSMFGKLGEAYQLRKHIAKRRKLAKEGYVEWYLIESTFPRPRFVKPIDRGASVPEIDHDGGRYAFPKDARIANETQGMWTFIHQKGDLKPINLTEPDRNAISPEAFKEYAEAEVQVDAPSFWSQLDLDTSQIVTYSVFGMIALAVVWGFVSGGGI